MAGRSNALSGFTDTQTFCPVIACPPYSDKFAGADIYSSLRMPFFVAPMTVLEPANAALAAAKILALSDTQLQEMMNFMENNIKYQTIVELKLRKSKITNYAIDEGGK
jgi:5-(carboxyamino)imidazole ribonucleotide mutase